MEKLSNCIDRSNQEAHEESMRIAKYMVSTKLTQEEVYHCFERLRELIPPLELRDLVNFWNKMVKEGRVRVID